MGWVVCNREIVARENTRHGEATFQRIASRKNGEGYHVNVLVEQSRDQRDTCIPFFTVHSALFFYVFRLHVMMEAEILCVFKRTACCNVSIGENMSWSVLI